MAHHLDLVIFIVAFSKWSLSCFLLLAVFTRLHYALVVWMSVVFDTLFKAILTLRAINFIFLFHSNGLVSSAGIQVRKKHSSLDLLVISK